MMLVVLRRVVWAVVVILLATTITFFITAVLPGDPARLALGPQASTEDVARVRHELALDAPIGERFAAFAHRLVHLGPHLEQGHPVNGHATCAAPLQLPEFMAIGENRTAAVHIDFGRSTYFRRPVRDILVQRLPRTLKLAGCALLLEVLFGTALAIVCASREGRFIDIIFGSGAAVLTSIPTVLIGLGLQFVFAYRLGILPIDGFGTTPEEQLRSLILPAGTLAIASTAVFLPIARNEILSEISRDHARFARAKGASMLRVLLVHGVRNAIVPITAALTLDLAAFLSGAVVVEAVFRYPGIGQLSVDAMLNRDGPLVIGCTLISATAIVVTTMVGDILSRWLDPRIRSQGER